MVVLGSTCPPAPFTTRQIYPYDSNRVALGLGPGFILADGAALSKTVRRLLSREREHVGAVA